jgi:tetraacyldisaccharide 4'-kinase
MNFIYYILLPFSFLYGLVTDIRNYGYDKGFWKETTFDTPIINVGNLTVGGTGKTPHVEYLIRLLANKFAIVTLSRGYGRETKGFLLADSKANAHTIGDEPYQFYQKFKQEINVAVGEDRVEAVSKIITQKPETNLIILDDAFQHRAIKPFFNILLMDFSRPIYDDFVFPAGRLRERRHGAKRTDALIVSKCPDDFTIEKQISLTHNLQCYLRENTPIFFTKILYGKPLNCRSEKENSGLGKVILLSGIANPKPFEEYAKRTFEVINHLIFKDHHDFKEKDLREIMAQNDFDGTVILMTEKDMVKFQPFLNHPLLKGIELYYLSIEIGFLNNEMKANFDELILSQLSTDVRTSNNS